ncbi:CRISPR-associated protein Cas4 [Archaeoglobales archaeon]|nr:MAG: CRISPR-associated protein Cas4 [Archaeoglobales archaeon]
MDVVNLLYEFERENRLKRSEKEIHVTDLVRCPLKREFEIKYPEMIPLLEPAITLGNLIHLALEEILKSKCNAQVEVEKRVEIGDVTLIGKIDAIVDDVGIEIKYSRSGNHIPYIHHVKQVEIYNWLFELNYSVLVYVTPDRITQFTIKEKATQDQIINLMKDNTIPRYDWECNYCYFSKICPNKR